MCVVTLLLTACGNSHPLPSASSLAPAPAASGSSTMAPTHAYKPATGMFSSLSAPASSTEETTNNCNIDAIDGAAPGSKPLPRGTTAMFAGWAATGNGSTIPKTVQIVLQGAHDFAVQVPTGASRPDVAQSTGKSGLAKSGYQINADVSAVPAGTYKLTLRYQANGKQWRCTATHAVTVQ